MSGRARFFPAVQTLCRFKILLKMKKTIYSGVRAKFLRKEKNNGFLIGK